MKTDIFYYQFVLIPVAIPLIRKFSEKRDEVEVTSFRVVLIFGFRVAYWTVIEKSI